MGRNDVDNYDGVKHFALGKNILIKPRSDTNVHEDNICSLVQCECEESLNYSSILKQLKLEDGEKMSPTRDMETHICTSCFNQENKVMGFRTREISSLRLVIQGHEILNYQGIKHSPEDVAPYWKKDSRMWLWKSIRLTRKRRNKSKSLTRFPSFA
ncbi:hypothetical protein PV327_006021 [Microctonus hyperodae]|uniref:Uncharacterized protein n=1 Tax=Microctonus hyperodae TaxID=165561 RepID=A0AA39G2K9_MICHY|nr:hypothetical protein PV327_006021 [Microctonus hyperodae]